MGFLSKFTFGMTLLATVLSVDAAGAAPRLMLQPVQQDGLVTKVAGIYCDPSGCRTYETRRRIYIDPPPPYFDDDPPIYLERRPSRRVYIDPPIYDEPRPVLTRRHVQWCLDRYRSYDPRTNLFLARRHVYRQCVSPWS